MLLFAAAAAAAALLPLAVSGWILNHFLYAFPLDPIQQEARGPFEGRTNIDDSVQAFGLKGVLELPQSFGTIHLGACTCCMNVILEVVVNKFQATWHACVWPEWEEMRSDMTFLFLPVGEVSSCPQTDTSYRRVLMLQL